MEKNKLLYTRGKLSHQNMIWIDYFLKSKLGFNITIRNIDRDPFRPGEEYNIFLDEVLEGISFDAGKRG